MQIAGVPMARYQSSRRKESLSPSRKPASDNVLQPRPFPLPESQEPAPPNLNRDTPPPQFSITDPHGSRPQPIQPKLTIGAPGDKYEQEADRVASQVVQHINAPSANPSQAIQREGIGEEDELQMKPMLQRLEMPEEEELQMKPMLQRMEIPEEEELQMKSAPSAGIVEGEAAPDLETSIQQARGGGQALAPDLQTKMGQAMGADFSQVRVHTNTQSDQLNRSIQAKAFTTGQDIFFRQGAYQPGNRGGQELIAHELTHVVQQIPGTLQRQTLADIPPEMQEEMEEEGGYIQAKLDGLPSLQNAVIQRAYVGRRPLGGKIKGVGSIASKPWIKNKGIYHEHIFFEDGQAPPDWGFMGTAGCAQEKAKHLGIYTQVPGKTGLDDGIMRQAVANIGNPGAYKLLGNNCQVYVSRVLAEYRTLGGT
ncbi:DUF4157 domain-containing protein [Phormidium sp. FACHB-1136]|uniref:eCIS core domain-containing protein n=1 Tax=Phormidium sp. FACHB-1136 TaxID=2692848 RepID=UPI0016840A03|nr:DUF4157 domain-containing protein [Phormidium sp. FACHB-1136]MBD2427060.1 DUF4157 domain-containing protein [Phormidium sp. FACHB-1136]